MGSILHISNIIQDIASSYLHKIIKNIIEEIFIDYLINQWKVRIQFKLHVNENQSSNWFRKKCILKIPL